MVVSNGVADFVRAARRNCESEVNLISDDELRDVLTSAIKLYAQRTERSGAFPPPISGQDATATEVVTTVSEMLRAVDINMFDLSMWFGRRRS